MFAFGFETWSNNLVSCHFLIFEVQISSLTVFDIGKQWICVYRIIFFRSYRVEIMKNMYFIYVHMYCICTWIHILWTLYVVKTFLGIGALPCNRIRRGAWGGDTGDHWQINYIDNKAKCRHLKKLTCKGTLQQVFVCLRPPPFLWRHTPPPPQHTVYEGILLHKGKGGDLNQKEG